MAFYSDDIIEEVKSASDIVDVVSKYVNLRRRGNTYVGLCPFHHEKTGSFSVSKDKQIFHCFGCGVGGNVVSFIMKIENLGFKEAMEFLAEKAGITLPTTSEYDIEMSKDELIKLEADKKEMYEINKVAGRFFYDNIEKSLVAQKYIAERKIEAKTVAKYGLGFALDDNGLTKCLQANGFSEKNMLATGLIGKNDRGVLYDKFKNRFMFPIFDIQKRLIAFGGRTLESKEEMKAKGIPKYVNSPENLIYSKGKHLYGLNVAKSHNSGKMKRILVVEGYMDVISPHQAGITNVVASLGTALTERQGRLLRQYADEVILSYDSDDAGQKAILRGIDILQALNVPTRILQMHDAKDPDEFVLKFGSEKFEKLIDNSISPVEYKVNLIKKEYDFKDTTQKIAFLTKLADILSKVDNVIERDVYVDQYSRELKVGKEAIIAEIEKRTLRNSFGLKKWQLAKPIASQEKETKQVEVLKEKNEELVIYLLTLKDENIFHKLKSIYTNEDIMAFKNPSFVKKLYNLYETGDINSKELMTVCETEEENSLLSEVLIKSSNSDNSTKHVEEVLRALETDKLQNEKMKIIKSLQDGNSENEEVLATKLNEINLKLARK